MNSSTAASDSFAPALPADLNHSSRLVRQIKTQARHAQAVSAAWAARWFGPRPGPSTGILMYHRVAPLPSGVPVPTWNVTPDHFRKQLTGLLERGFQPVRLADLVVHAKSPRDFPPRAFAVTFDDGYECVYHWAWPILRQLRVPATLFLATAFIDRPAPFACDDWSEAGSPRVPGDTWRPLSTHQVQQMVADGWIDLGCHTHTHADFRGQPQLLASDLRRSVEWLRQRWPQTEHQFPFAFPYGTTHLGFAGGRLSDEVRQCGLACALSTDSFRVLPGTDPFAWGRFAANDEDTADTLSGKLLGWYEWLGRLTPRRRPG